MKILSGHASELAVAPLWTPPGGVKFTKMSVELEISPKNTPASFSFDIYDAEGKLVATSGIKTYPCGFLENAVVVSGEGAVTEIGTRE